MSSQVQQSIEENFKRRLPAEAFARTSVEFSNEGCYLSLIKVFHINRLGTVFMDETVCVFIRAAFPWRMGLRKIKGHTLHCIRYPLMKQGYSKVRTMLKNNLISLLDTAFPDANRLFTSPPRADGSEKWVDFVAAFWHCECVCGLSEKAFTAKYQKWCKKHGYNFSEDKALDIYASACGHFGVMPKMDTTKLLVEQAISQLQATSAALAALKQEMQSLAASLPEYPVVMEMFGVGPALGPQLIAEIGDVRRFHSKKALVAFAGIDAPPYQSGQIDVRSRSISKRGSASLRRTLFLVMGVLLQCAPMDEPVYQFMDKKRSEGKPYRVYMMASANKFLRIYYASVKAYLDSLEHD